jgi:hypothetical protein
MGHSIQGVSVYLRGDTVLYFEARRADRETTLYSAGGAEDSDIVDLQHFSDMNLQRSFTPSAKSTPSSRP